MKAFPKALLLASAFGLAAPVGAQDAPPPPRNGVVTTVNPPDANCLVTQTRTEYRKGRVVQVQRDVPVGYDQDCKQTLSETNGRDRDIRVLTIAFERMPPGPRKDALAQEIITTIENARSPAEQRAMIQRAGANNIRAALTVRGMSLVKAYNDAGERGRNDALQDIVEFVLPGGPFGSMPRSIIDGLMPGGLTAAVRGNNTTICPIVVVNGQRGAKCGSVEWWAAQPSGM